jgi:hypothetical protein
MPRRLLAQALAGSLVLMGATIATADDPPQPDLPRPECTHDIVDITGDAAPNYLSGTDTSAVFPSKPALDIRGLHIRVTADQLQILLPLAQTPIPEGMEAYEADYRYFVTFSLGGKSFKYGFQVKNAGQPAQPQDSPQFPEYLVNNVAFPTQGPASKIVPDLSPQPAYVLFTTPRPILEAALGAALAPTDQFTNLAATTEVDLSQKITPADHLDITTAQASRAVGDDFCFGPAPTTLTDLAIDPVQYGDEATIDVTLKDEHGDAMPDEDVAFSADTGPLSTATTDADGLAEASFPATLLAGTYPVSASFEGDEDVRSSSASGSLVIVPEVTTLGTLQVTKPSKTSRTASVAVLDDDKTPVVAQKVEWWVNGKKVATTSTDAAGKTTYKSLKPGQTVQAKFPVVTGMYAAAASKSVKV